MSGPMAESTCMIHEPIDEERIVNYNPNLYFPTHPGQVLNARYQTITKLGWGFGSTVWLAEDLWQSGTRQPSSSVTPSIANEHEEEPKSPRYVAIKIGTSTSGSIAAAEHELKLSQHIATANPSHPGAGYIRCPINNFQLGGPHGTHICLVYNPMRETLDDFLWSRSQLPLRLPAEYPLSGPHFLSLQEASSPRT
ncbi:hypothetical protein OIDMADRAFT_184438 [Oidiodendron maius Zn]|uniref:non-specific serine/threonine protein kinase n=1 Tax=Oidiodendron maius (strain Zn) TaxID=913774 RepID=A0A0C3CXH3_OIDMZ|nr:hypothetical protein OIDMADRAFT_184438 [Oidiodendron maius Zn]